MNFEIQDYQRREEEARVNRSVPRSCPTADAYRGLYERHFLFSYLPGHSKSIRVQCLPLSLNPGMDPPCQHLCEPFLFMEALLLG